MNTRGYTLVELVVVISIATLTIVAVAASAIIFYHTNTGSLNQSYAIESARGGMENMVGDIRGTQYGADGSYPVASVATSSVTFYDDTNGDGITERVRYFISGTSLIRGVTSVSGTPPTYSSTNEVLTTVSTAVQNAAENIPLFQFYDASGKNINTVSLTDPIVYVSVTLIINTAPSESGSEDYTLHSTAALRNASQF